MSRNDSTSASLQWPDYSASLSKPRVDRVESCLHPFFTLSHCLLYRRFCSETTKSPAERLPSPGTLPFLYYSRLHLYSLNVHDSLFHPASIFNAPGNNGQGTLDYSRDESVEAAQEDGTAVLRGRDLLSVDSLFVPAVRIYSDLTIRSIVEAVTFSPLRTIQRRGHTKKRAMVPITSG